jgi:hypothetical protein
MPGRWFARAAGMRTATTSSTRMTVVAVLCEAIPSARLSSDSDGAEAKRFDAEVSGQTLLGCFLQPAAS